MSPSNIERSVDDWCSIPSSSSYKALTFHHQSTNENRGIVAESIIPACFHGSIDRSSRDPLAVIFCWIWRPGKHNIATRNLRSETCSQSKRVTEIVVPKYFSSNVAPRFSFSIQSMADSFTRWHYFFDVIIMHESLGAEGRARLSRWES
jgi:hypothetical protein